jgi:L-methionine (R)-S-oxide reductase
MDMTRIIFEAGQNMADNLIIKGESKVDLYHSLTPQIAALIAHEPDSIANWANIAAALKQTFNFLWVGFYRVVGDELVLGPFQGPIACTRITKGKGVCGAAWAQNKTLIVPDVDLFPGHIACSSLSRSEIVVPVHNANGELVAVLDVDSEALDKFDSTDQYHLEAIVKLLKQPRI